MKTLYTLGAAVAAIYSHKQNRRFSAQQLAVVGWDAHLDFHSSFTFWRDYCPFYFESDEEKVEIYTKPLTDKDEETYQKLILNPDFKEFNSFFGSKISLYDLETSNSDRTRWAREHRFYHRRMYEQIWYLQFGSRLSGLYLTSYDFYKWLVDVVRPLHGPKATLVFHRGSIRKQPTIEILTRS